MADQPEKIPQHKHCHRCGKAFTGDGLFCGDECKESTGKEAKSKLKKLGLIWLVIVAVTLVLVAIYMFV